MRVVNGAGCRPASRRGLPAFMRRFSAEQSGATIIIFAIGFSVVALATAIAIDYGRVELEQVRMQRAIDAAALAAAHRLGQPDQDESGQAAAQAFFKANVPQGSKLAIEDMKLDPVAGTVTFVPGHVPAAGSVVRAGFEFDVPVRFDTDRIDVDLSHFDAGRIPAIPLTEILP